MKKEPKKDLNPKQNDSRKQEYLERCKKAMETFKDLYIKDIKDPLEE